MTVLKEAVAAITNRDADYKEAEQYYEGEVSERFATAQLRHVLRTTKHRGSHNYIRVISDAVLNRLEIANITASTPEAQAKVDAAWEDNEMDLEANEVHRRALEYGDCYALVWPDETGEVQISYNSPRTTALVYDPENPRKKQYGVKMWKVGNPFDAQAKSTRLNIYLPDRILKYVVNSEEVTEGTNWVSLGEEENPFGAVPIFHFRTHRPYGVPEGKAAFGAQDDVNKLLATHMFTVDYQGAPQRYALAYTGDTDAVDFGDDETERENVGALHSDPGSLWYLKGIMNVGQFNPADPAVFWNPINALKQSMATLTSTPFHYLQMPLSVSGGEAMRVAEAPLLKKVADRQSSFGATWKELFKFVLKIEGITDVRVDVKWGIVESMDALGQWDVMLKKINAGLSHRQALREKGYAEADVERIMNERAQEAAEGAYYQRKPDARVSTNDNENFDNRNGLTEDAKINGGRGEDN